jgi:phosphoglycerate kinase
MRTSLDELEVGGRRVLLRADLNVPMHGGQVSDATRIERLLPTVKHLTERGAHVVVTSHFGRPKGQVVPGMSLAAVVPALSSALGQPVAFAEDCVGEAAAAVVGGLADGQVALLENLRFHAGEEQNDPEFAARLAELGDCYVNDAFSCAHRAHASTEALARLLPAAVGLGMAAELRALGGALDTPERPLAAVIGGAKVSTKLEVLNNLVARVDVLIIGGGMANTFLYARGVDVGRSLCEHELAETARDVETRAAAAGCTIVLPDDVVVAAELAAGVAHQTVSTAEVPADAMILDIGPASALDLRESLGECRTLVWNGPLGAFETPPFDAGTNAVARAAAELTAAGRLTSVAGGGDTLAALAQAGAAGDFSYLSTAGGAFLDWLAGKTLPGVAALEMQ